MSERVVSFGVNWGQGMMSDGWVTQLFTCSPIIWELRSYATPSLPQAKKKTRAMEGEATELASLPEHSTVNILFC